MTSQPKTPKQPAKPKGSSQIGSGDDPLAEGELSQEDLEKVAGGAWDTRHMNRRSR